MEGKGDKPEPRTFFLRIHRFIVPSAPRGAIRVSRRIQHRDQAKRLLNLRLQCFDRAR